MQDSTSSKPLGNNTPPPNDRVRPASESEFLAAQAATARAAVTDTLERMRADLKDSSDLGAWARKYPWPTVGVAAAFGFLAAQTLLAKREQPPAAEAPVQAAAAAKPSMFANLMSEILRNFGGALQAGLIALINSKMQPPAPPAPSTNGHDESADVL